MGLGQRLFNNSNRLIPERQSEYTYSTRTTAVGLTWDGIASKMPVIPAKAGIQFLDNALPKACGVDSRFRGNDCDLQRPRK